MLPAAGQGALGIEVREDATDLRALMRRCLKLRFIQVEDNVWRRISLRQNKVMLRVLAKYPTDSGLRKGRFRMKPWR